jgi:molybdopterin-biosynthesis enzyme MoeA-like protein
MGIGALIIGDELLSGKREDKHFSHLQSVLAKRNLELDWTMIVGDDPEQLQRFMAFSMASKDIVFSFGGIGATPDDRTRSTVAKVAEVSLVPHPQAVAEIEAQYGDTAYPNRILMANLPEGCRLIPNSINRVPGFSFEEHHFMPGFPEMAWPMIEWVLDTYYSELRNTAPADEQIIYIMKGRESDLLYAMKTIDSQYPELRLSSLPRMGEQTYIELSLRGETDLIDQAMDYLKAEVEKSGFEWLDQLPDK